MNRNPRRKLRSALRCHLCGQEIIQGERYWYLNGCCVCGDCFPAFAERELSPYRCICGKEGGE